MWEKQVGQLGGLLCHTMSAVFLKIDFAVGPMQLVSFATRTLGSYSYKLPIAHDDDGFLLVVRTLGCPIAIKRSLDRTCHLISACTDGINRYFMVERWDSGGGGVSKHSCAFL